MTEKELARGVERRLAIIRHAQEVTGNISATCRYFGNTLHAFYMWLRHCEEQGVDEQASAARTRQMGGNGART